MARIFKALGDPSRLSILRLLHEHRGALCVTALADITEISQSAVSQHLRVLKDVGLVQGRRTGSKIHYSINEEVAKEYRSLFSELFA